MPIEIELRQYQTDINNAVYNAWDFDHKNIMMVLPTGAGKTVCLSSIVKKESGAVCVIAHRQELVSQISMSLAKNNIHHRIIAPKKIIKMVMKMHTAEFGESFYDFQSKVAVAGVDTLVRRKEELKTWLPTVKLWVIDEAHHLLSRNKWGTAVEMFPNAKGLGVTATPLRSDGLGLGADNDGEMHTLVSGPSMRELINQGYLTEYRIFSPANNIDMSEARESKATGDYNINDVSEAISKSSLVVHKPGTVIGDVVEHYTKIAYGKLGITFVPDMNTGHEIVQQFNSVGIPSILLNAKTPDDERAGILKKFANRDYWQIINVDILGEGFDCPSIEVVSMARPTQSYGLYVQQFGRALRIMEGKEYGIIIDHVGNVTKHGLPDAPQNWTLERTKKKKEAEITTVKTCPVCTNTYERYLKVCPYCGHVHIPAERSSIEYVDGDLTELIPEVLAQMRGEVDLVDAPLHDRLQTYTQELLDNYCKPAYIRNHVRRMSTKYEHQQESQVKLREKMAWWGGHRRSEGRTDDEIFKIFYITYGVDWITAQSLPGDDADALTEGIILGKKY